MPPRDPVLPLPGRPGASRLLLANLVLAAAYWGISQLNWLLFSGAGVLPMPLWPAAGLALAAAVALGWRCLPGLAAGALLANHATLGAPLALSTGVAVMNALGPVLGAAALRRLATPALRLRGPLDLGLALGIAVLLVPALTATGAMVARWLLAEAPAGGFSLAWSKWVMAHALGTLLVGVPLLIGLKAAQPPAEPNDAGPDRTPALALWTGILLAMGLWLADSLLEHLWFNPGGRPFTAFLLPFGDVHELLNRSLYAIALLMSGVVAAVVLARLRIARLHLQAAAEDLRVTLDSIGDGVIATDAAGRVTRLNPVAERLTGWPLPEAAGRPLPEVFRIVNAASRAVVDDPVQRVLATGTIVGLANHTVLIARDGRESQIADSAAPIRDAAGRLTGVVLVFRDVTQEYALQEQVRQGQKMDAIGQLAGGVAHDFNNMLGGILGGAELLLRRLPADHPGRRQAQMIIEASERAAGLTRKLLSFARRQPTGSTPIDVHQAVREAMSLLKTTCDPRIAITIDLAAARSLVVGDHAQLENVFLNLGINAVQAMPDGGGLTVRSREAELDAAACRQAGGGLHPGSYLEVTVRDTGCGIPPEHLARIFEPFFTTKPQGQGTGLGLSAALGSVQQHQGVITVASEPGAGTCFHVLLPLADGPAQPAPLPALLAAGSGRILLVDDEPLMRATAASILEDAGYQVAVAVDGRAGVDAFAEQPSAFDLVILDMAMPGMSGRDCFHALRRIRPDLPILLASGFLRDEDLHDLKASGLAGFIPKPFRAVELAALVAVALGRGRSSASQADGA